MKRIMNVFVAAMFAALMISCEDNTSDAGFLTVSNDRFTDVPADGESYSLKVESNISWQVVVADGSEWIVPTVLDGSGNVTVNFTVEPNTGDTRTGSFSISPLTEGVGAAVVTVSQVSGKPEFVVKTTRVAKWDLTMENLKAAGTWAAKAASDLTLGGFGTSYLKDTSDVATLKYYAVTSDKRTATNLSSHGRFYVPDEGKDMIVFGAEWTGDYWYFEVPSDKFAAGTELCFEGTYFASKTATQKYWALEYSLDGGTTWKLMGEELKTSVTNDSYTHAITFAGSGMELKGSATLTGAPKDNVLIIRYRAASTQNKTDDGEVAASTSGNVQWKNEIIISVTEQVEAE